MRINVRSRFLILVLLLVIPLSFLPSTALADQQEISVGYGLGTLNKNADPGHLHSGDYYDFVQIAYGYEKLLSGKFNILVEPFVAIVNRPQSGLDGGLTLNGRCHFGQENYTGLFVTAGFGGAHTSVDFEDHGGMGETTACLSAFLILVEQLADRLCQFALVEGFHEELLDSCLPCTFR